MSTVNRCLICSKSFNNPRGLGIHIGKMHKESTYSYFYKKSHKQKRNHRQFVKKKKDKKSSKRKKQLDKLMLKQQRYNDDLIRLTNKIPLNLLNWCVYWYFLFC